MPMMDFTVSGFRECVSTSALFDRLLGELFDGVPSSLANRTVGETARNSVAVATSWCNLQPSLTRNIGLPAMVPVQQDCLL